MSPVTWHMSPVTCHLSPVTYHLSPVTCHLSPITCHLSPVTCHLSPVTWKKIKLNKNNKSDKVVEVVVGGSNINGATPSFFLQIPLLLNLPKCAIKGLALDIPSNCSVTLLMNVPQSGSASGQEPWKVAAKNCLICLVDSQGYFCFYTLHLSWMLYSRESLNQVGNFIRS